MHIRTFRAASLQSALDEIRRQMGPEASVLHTRQVRDGWLGWLGRAQVEVTAGLRDSHDPAPVMATSEPLTEPDSSATFPNRSSSFEPDATSTPSIEAFADPLKEIHRELLAAGTDERVAQRWMETARRFALDAGNEKSPGNYREVLQSVVARELKLSGPIRTRPGKRHVVALVGPTGVGKTTTIAKLAAGFRIEARRRVGLLTIDTFRIAAVQQLKAYAEIMDLPMEVVEQSDQMQSALDRLGDVDLVLIDTAGRSPRSEARIEQLLGFMRAAQPDETHLVLSATSSLTNTQSVLQGFAPVHPTAAILTKLDEAPQTATVLSALHAPHPLNGMPLSYVTNGQQVPDDIALADADFLAARLLPWQPALPALDAA